MRKIILVKNVKDFKTCGYGSKPISFLKKSTFPVIGVKSISRFHCPSWKLEIEKGAGLYNNWALKNFDWHYADTNIKYII